MAYIKWAETQPVGDANHPWYVGAISDDGGCILVGGGGSTATGKLYYSSNGGTSWSVTDPYGDSSSRNWYWGSVSSDGTKMFVGGSRLWYTSNSGSSWTEVRPDGDRDFNYPLCLISNDGTKLAVAEYTGKIWYSSNSGSSWSEIRSTGGYNGFCMSGDGTKLFTGVWNGRSYYSSNSGSSWSEVQPKGDVNGSWGACSMSDDGTKILVVEYGGRVYYSSNSGTNWSEKQPNGNSNFNWYGVSMSSDGSNMLLSIDGSHLYKSIDSGTSWYQQRPAGDSGKSWQYCCELSGDSSKWIAGCFNGRLYLGVTTSVSTFYVNTGSTVGGTGITNETTGADRAYATLGEATTQLAWAASDSNMEVQCCGSTTDASLVDLASVYVQTGYTFSINGNPTHSNGANTGVYDATKYTKVRDVTNQEGIRISSSYTGQKISISKIQFRVVQQTLPFYIAPGCACDVYLESSLLSVASGSPIHSYMTWQRASNTSTLNVLNCVFNYEGAGVCSGTAISFEGGTSKVYNSLIRGFTVGLTRIGSQTVTAKNCAVFDNTNDFDGAIPVIDHCASDDGDGTNPITVASWATQFYNASYASVTDFRLVNISTLLSAGVGPSADANAPTTDILGNDRTGATSTVGAFEHYYGWIGCLPGALHGSTGGQYWNTVCAPSKHYVKYSLAITDNPGATGLQGATGIGSVGAQGTQGTAGAQGLQGQKGSTGIGAVGAQGLQGATGLPGSAGLRGEKGSLPGVTGVLLVSMGGGDTSIQTGYRSNIKLPYNTVFESWEVVLQESGTFVSELDLSTYGSWATPYVMNNGSTGPYVMSGIKNSASTLSGWAGTTGAYGDYLSVKVLESTVSTATIVLKHYEKR